MSSPNRVLLLSATETERARENKYNGHRIPPFRKPPVADAKQSMMNSRHRFIGLQLFVHLHELLDAGLLGGFPNEFREFHLAISLRLLARLLC